MNKKLNVIVLLFLTVLFTNCSQNEKPDGFDYGHKENNKYVNSFFGLEVSLPDDWGVQTKEQTENLKESSKDMVAGDNENLKAIINVTDVNSANLVSVFQYEVGAAVEYNPGFMVIVENLKNAPEVKNGSDYLFQSRKLLEQSQMQYSNIDEEFQKELIDNQEFYTMNCSIDLKGQLIKQRYYSTIRNGFCLSAIISYANDEQKKDLEEIVNSMDFEN